MKPLVVLTGPTAVGKTNLSIKLAKFLNTEIISADAVQVYKHLDIGSAKISKEEMGGVNHHLIDICEIDEDYSVNSFKEEALIAMDEIYASGKIPLIVGGTGFYIQSILKDVDFTSFDTDEEYRNSLYELAETKGADYLHNMLKEVDEEAAKAIHPNNIKRVARALEYFKLTGKKISHHNETESQKVSPYNYLYFVLSKDRSMLYERINQRVDKMFDDGFEDEVKKLIALGAKPEYNSMQGIGYKELLSYYNNSDMSLEETKDLIKQNTRHYAKRQMTWFRREDDVIYLDTDKFTDDELLQIIIDKMKEKGMINV